MGQILLLATINMLQIIKYPLCNMQKSCLSRKPFTCFLFTYAYLQFIVATKPQVKHKH